MAELKTKLTTKSAAAVLKAVEPKQKSQDCLELVKIFQEVTKEKPKVWGEGIIGFGMYHYESERSAQMGDWPLVAFASRKQTIALYLMAKFPSQKAALKKLGKYKLSGSCVHIKSLSDINVPALKTMIANCAKEMRKRYPASK